MMPICESLVYSCKLSYSGYFINSDILDRLRDGVLAGDEKIIRETAQEAVGHGIDAALSYSRFAGSSIDQSRLAFAQDRRQRVGHLNNKRILRIHDERFLLVLLRSWVT
jgi:hypothetical protein